MSFQDISNIPPRVWFITGCSSGFGLTLVELLLSIPNQRIVATLRKPSAISHLQSQNPPNDNKLLILPLDVTKTDQIDEAFDKAKSHFGRIDVVINNAGFGYVAETESMTDEQGRNQLDVNFWGVVNVTKKAVAFFREVNPAGEGGRILQISSGAGFVGYPLLSFYAASKFALEGFTESFNQELPPEWNIKMTIIQLGGYNTKAGENSVILAPHPAYASPTSPTMLFRQAFANIPREGDVVKACKVMINVAVTEEPPLKLPLGKDVVGYFTDKCKAVMDELEKWKEVAMGVSSDPSPN